MILDNNWEKLLSKKKLIELKVKLTFLSPLLGRYLALNILDRCPVWIDVFILQLYHRDSWKKKTKKAKDKRDKLR